MKKMRKLLAVTMTAALALSLTACGSSSSAASSESSASSSAASTESAASTGTSGKVYNIGICQLVEHKALDAATKGFQDAVIEKLGKDNVKFDLQNAQGEQANCTTIVSGFVSNNVDLIMANATTALQAAAASTDSIPIVGTSITDYATALNIKDWSGTTGKNITGTSDLAPLDQQVDMLTELIPSAKQVGLLYCSSEANSLYQVQQVEKLLDKKGIKYKEYAAADSNEIQSVTTKAISDCDVLYVPTDNTMASNIEIVKNITVPAKIPVIAGEEGICAGGLATLSISYYDIGYQAGVMAAEILKDGKDPKTMPIQFAEKTTKEYNPTIAKELGFTMPSDYTAIEGY